MRAARGRRSRFHKTNTPEESRLELAGSLTEEDFQAALLGFVDAMGGLAFHARNMRGSREGWPDLAIWLPGHAHQLTIAELKTPKGRWSDNQRVWREILQGVDYLKYHAWTTTDPLESIAREMLECQHQ